MQTVLREDPLHAAEAHLERQRDVIGEDQRPGARAAFAAVDRDEVDAARPVGHQARQVLPERRIADGGLDADRQTGFAGDRLDEIEHLVGVPERAVRGRADAVAVHRDAADLGDLAGDLRPRQHAADARLRALTELDLDRANLRCARDRVLQPRHAEAPVGSRQPK